MNALGGYLPEDRVENLAAFGEALAVRTGQLDSAGQAFSAALAAAGEMKESQPGIMEDIRRRRASALFGAGETRARDGRASCKIIELTGR